MTRLTPAELITESPSVCVKINKQWVSYVMGRLQALTQDWFWSGTDEEIYDATQQAEALMLALDIGNEACMTPIGSIVAWPVTHTPISAPEGWVNCDGSILVNSDYSDLFALIGTTYGVGTPGYSFKVPDLRGRFPLGASGSHAIASTGGAETHFLTIAQLPAHAHAILVKDNTTNQSNARLSSAGSTGTNSSSVTDAEGAGQSHNNMPPFITLNYIIRGR